MVRPRRSRNDRWRWAGSILLAMAWLCPVAWLAVGCGGPEPEPPAIGGLYASLDCGRCHGMAGEGMRTAPPMLGMDELWDEDGLVAFLKDPKGTAAEDPRLMVASERYALTMAPVQADDDTLRELARQLLELGEAPAGQP
jgi:hypothetical protein